MNSRITAEHWASSGRVETRTSATSPADLAERLKGWIQENPGTALVSSIATGLLLGMILKARK